MKHIIKPSRVNHHLSVTLISTESCAKAKLNIKSIYNMGEQLQKCAGAGGAATQLNWLANTENYRDVDSVNSAR